MAEVVDGRGRKLELRVLSALDKLRLIEAAGGALAGNDRWLGMAMVAASVAAIDALPFPLPVAKAGIEAMVERLGDEGIEAAAAALAPDERADAALAGN